LVLPDAGIAKVGSAWVVTRYQRRAMWQVRSWFPVAGSSAVNVTGGRKLARHDS
jgi:hypothetical protein